MDSPSAALDDPARLYRCLLTGKVLQRSRALGGVWVCGQYRHCLNLLRDPRLSSGGKRDCNAAPPEETDLTRILSGWVVFRDGAEHRHVRQALNPAFGPATIAAFQSRISRVVTGFVDRFAASGGGEFMREVAWPLPCFVMGDLLGVDESLYEPLLHSTGQINDFLRAERPTPELKQTAHAALNRSRALFRQLIERRREQPADDLLSRIAGPPPGVPSLDEEELSLQCTMLVFGGHETTRNLAGCGLLTLLRNPEQLQRLRDDRQASIRPAVEEMARFESPARFVRRDVLEDMEYEGTRLAAGGIVLVCLGAANRDPRRFPDPDRFDIRREDNAHLAFGTGPHACIGANLARSIVHALVSRLLDVFPRLELRAEPRWAADPRLRKLERLEVG